jgi:hypothetical protein
MQPSCNNYQFEKNMLIGSFRGINSVKITGMNPKASFGNISQQAAGYCTPAYAG